MGLKQVADILYWFKQDLFHISIHFCTNYNTLKIEQLDHTNYNKQNCLVGV